MVARDGRGENVNKEDLGTQTIEGVEATGTRMTFTIPAGQIGNEGPINIVDERWFSKDLQTVVMTRHSDPRSGETVYRLTNINRTEPDHSLFEVPADYRIGIVPASDTGAVEIALWSLLGARPVTMLAWESFFPSLDISAS